MKNQLKNKVRDVGLRAIQTFIDVPRGATQSDWAGLLLEQERRRRNDRIPYPMYLYGMLSAGRTARACGASAFTAIEFGVAGGNGLLAMEEHADFVEQHIGIKVVVCGFDAGAGLPAPTDPRDCPFAFRPGEFPMNRSELQSRLQRASLFIGNVSDTARQFTVPSDAPIGFISNDLDYYTSTRDSFAVFDGPSSRVLPRVSMYFDDLLGYPYTSVTGEWAAINEYNATHRGRQIGQIVGLSYMVAGTQRYGSWTEGMFVLHSFDHPDYGNQEEPNMPTLELESERK